MPFIQVFTETELTGPERFDLRRREYVDFAECARHTMHWEGVNEREAKAIAVGMAIRSIINDDTKLGAFNERKAIVYSDDPRLVDYINFRPLDKEDDYLQRLIERICLLIKQHRIVLSYGKWFEIQDSNRELWSKVYGVKWTLTDRKTVKV